MYTIGQIEELTGVKAHVLRYWEEVVPGFTPQKDMSGRRLYSQKEVELIFRLKYLINEKKFTAEEYEVYIISLEATTNSPAYEKTTYYITKTDPRVLKEEDFSGSGRLMRTVLIPKYSKVPAGWVAVQIILRDELNKGEQTTQVVSDLTFDKLPNKVFTKAYLDSIN